MAPLVAGLLSALAATIRPALPVGSLAPGNLGPAVGVEGAVVSLALLLASALPSAVL